MNEFQVVAEKIKNSKRIVVLTGAGISTASGIPDFRSNPENKHLVPPLEVILSRHFFTQNPTDFWESCEEIFNFKELKRIEPNEAHLFLSELEHTYNKKVTIITQNIDGLHNKAGSTEVLDIHGNLNRVYCPHCGTVYLFDYTILQNKYNCSHVKNEKECGRPLSPLFVLYGDAINHKSKSNKRLYMADLFIVIGTSLKVSPANSFVTEFRHKRDMVFINREETDLINEFNHFLQGDIVDSINQIKKFLD